MSNYREIKEGLQYQGADEEIVYTLDTENYDANPTNYPSSPSVVIYENANGVFTDKSSTCISGSPTVTGTDYIITLPLIKSLTEGTLYRVEVKFTMGGQKFEPYAEIKAQR